MAALQMSWQPNLLHLKRKHGGPLGLKNLGNSCYLNSVLQCLTYTPPLANFCLNNLHSSVCDSTSQPDRKRDCPFCILEKRIVRSLSTDLTLDTPARIVNCLRIFAEHFKCGRQEDAHEFLRYVIDACHNTCLRLKKLQQQRVRKITNGSGVTFSANTIVKEIFGGCLQSQVKCLSCGTESNKVDEIMDICLEITNCSSLENAMKRFFLAEILDGNNKYKCERCKKLVPAKKQMSILQAPNVLVVQLKRFEGIFGGKIDRVIAFEEILVLSSFMCKASQDPHPEYSLFATIVHSGFSPESGHYYAYIKDAMGRWYCCNDSYVTLSTLEEVLSEKAYILFFSRTGQSPASADTAAKSNGAKPHEIKGSNSSISAISSTPKTMNMKSSNAPLVKGIPIASKHNNSSAILQNKFSGIANSLAKKVSGNDNGITNVEKRESMESNGNVGHSVRKQMNGNHTNSIQYNNGNCRTGEHDALQSSQVLVNGDANVKNKTLDPVRGSLCEDYGLKNKETAIKMFDDGAITNDQIETSRNMLGNGVIHNGQSHKPVDISGLKRKLEHRDSCILLAEDAESWARVEEFKQVLKKEAASVLQTCGWSDNVLKHMRSKKRLCMDACSSKDASEPKKLLISDAKNTFISQIPGSLKGSLIEHIRSFSTLK